MKNKTIKKNAFTVSVGWNGVDVSPQTVSSDGYHSLRVWQNNCYNQLTNKQFRIINAPTGSGKSYMMTLLSAEDMDNNSKLRTIIAVPQTVISAGFKDQKVLLPSGKKIHWIPGNDLCNGKHTNGTTKGLIKFIEGPRGTYSDRIVICTHATLVAAYKILKKTNRLHLLKNLNIWIDEAHHIMNVELEDVPDAILSNGIGEVITHLLKIKNNNVGLVTATFGRGDRCPLLTEKQEKDFIRFNLPYDEYLKNMKYMKSFSINFVLCGADWTKTIGEVISEKRCKDIIYIPHPMSANSTGDKYKESDLIIKTYNKMHGGKRKDICPLTTVGKIKAPFNILNLVDEDCREEKKEFINSLKKRPSEDLDAIITLGMFKEGADWVHANRGIVIGARESLVDMQQIIGRFFRDTPGKEHVEINILLPFSIDQIKDEDELKNNLNNYLKAIYLCLILENIFDPIKIKMPVTSQSSTTTGSVRQNYLSEMLPDESKQIALIDDVGNELIKISTDAKESGKTIRIWDEYEKVINDILTDHGIDSHQEEIAQEIWAMFTRKTVKLKGMSIDVIDFDILKDVDPVDSIFDYTSGICGIDTFQKLRDALRLANNFVSYEEAKKILHPLKIQSTTEYFERARTGEFDALGIPRDPQYWYSKPEINTWIDWGDFLGNGRLYGGKFVSYDEAQKICLAHNISCRDEYLKFSKTKEFVLLKLPKDPVYCYGKTRKFSWTTFLPNSKRKRANQYISIDEAKKIVHILGIISCDVYHERARTGEFDDLNIPRYPQTVYKKQGTWSGWGDYLGTGNRSHNTYPSYNEAIKIVKTLNIKTSTEYFEKARTGEFDDLNIPRCPQTVYEKQGTWISWFDYLGKKSNET